MDSFEFLDDKQWSTLWERYLAEALPYDPLRIREINCLIPFPNKKAGILIVTDQHIYVSKVNAVTTLHHFSSIHSFPEYQVLSICYKELGCFGTYKFPWVCPYFTLCPLEGKNRTIWINPQKISCIFKCHGQYYAQMTDGLCLVLPIQQRRVLSRAELACLLLATMRRGFFHFFMPGSIPLDFLCFPDTTFSNVLRIRPKLKKFRTSLGEINHLYNKTYSLYHCEGLIDDPREIDGIDWL